MQTMLCIVVVVKSARNIGLHFGGGTTVELASESPVYDLQAFVYTCSQATFRM